MRFCDIPGNEAAKARLRQMVDDKRIPHALILEGPQGVGKFLIARTMAQYIHCENHTQQGEPCGICHACRLHEGMNHLDTFYVFPIIKPDGARTAPISDDYMEEFREFLKKSPWMDIDHWIPMLDKKNTQPEIYVTESDALVQRLSKSAHIADYKVVVMWLPERMNLQCANKLLKLIEEPHADTIFLLISDNSAEVLPTIYSRCQRVTMRRLSDSELARWLECNRALDPQEALAVAHVADGSVTEAERQLEGAKSAASRNFELFTRLMRLAYQRKVGELRKWAADVTDLGREAEIKFYTYAQRLIRENFIYNFGNPQLSYLNRTEADFSRNFAPFVNERNAGPLMAEFNRAMIDIAGNGNGKIVNFDLAIKVILLLKQ